MLAITHKQMEGLCWGVRLDTLLKPRRPCYVLQVVYLGWITMIDSAGCGKSCMMSTFGVSE